jgi:hypothetical protein
MWIGIITSHDCERVCYKCVGNTQHEVENKIIERVKLWCDENDQDWDGIEQARDYSRGDNDVNTIHIFEV